MLTKDEEFSKYGIGIYLYFQSLKYYTFVFLLMGLVSITSMVNNLNGNG